MHDDKRGAMDLDRMGRQLFALLVCLLKPLVRTVRGTLAGGMGEQRLAAPVQQGTVIVEQRANGALVND